MHYKVDNMLSMLVVTSMFNGRKPTAKVYLSMFFLAQVFKTDTLLAFLGRCSFP